MNLGDFDKFFFALNGVKAFPWQQRLMDTVAKNGWPESLNLPTSAGKTAAIDIALFHLAVEADKGQERKAPVRIFFVVDRRLVVDEAYERARRINERLSAALKEKDGILKEVANRLAALSGDGDTPVDVLRLRGGLPRERAFLRNPTQPAVIVSTVDQVGSRLLFRGYGVSDYMRPIHAALIGMDSILILDEAHLSRPFRETLDWVEQYQRNAWFEQPIGRPLCVVEMTATPVRDENVFILSTEDRDNEVLGARLNRSKPAQLIEVQADNDAPEKTAARLVNTLSAEARKLMVTLQGTLTAPVVGVIVNRVATARSTFEILTSEVDSDAVLLTGRVRPYERDTILENYLPRMRAGRAENANVKPLYVVATQTVEVGADLDFDALVSESAALDALRQRFGRLNRLGNREAGPAVIVHTKSGKGKDGDPIYGEALDVTWKWLGEKSNKPRGQKRKVIDFGIASLGQVLPESDQLATMLTPAREAPVLMPSHVDLLAQTSPPPSIEPEISLCLHGIDTQPEDVQIVWRADLPESLTKEAADRAIETVAILPPVQRETLALPVWTVRAFLRNAGIDHQLSDVEGRGSAEETSNSGGRVALRWRGEDESEIVNPNEIHPGDTIVLPSSYGGLDKYGWHPDCREAVIDVADKAVAEKWGRNILRLHPAILFSWFEGADAADSLEAAQNALQEVLTRYQEGEDLSLLCEEIVEVLLRLPSLQSTVGVRLKSLTDTLSAIAYPALSPAGILLSERVSSSGQFTDEDDTSSLTQEVLLDDHCKSVAALAYSNAHQCGLPNDVLNDIEMAARLHDLGKADFRFQAWLRGGDRLSARGVDRLLAKSARLTANDRFSVILAREQAGYPKGARHECYSVAIVNNNPQLLTGANDKDLVQYLIGVHHGRGRPFLPAIEDTGMPALSFQYSGAELTFEGPHELERLDSGWLENYWRLIRRYGYWGLAYLEMILRLADHKSSQEGH